MLIDSTTGTETVDYDTDTKGNVTAASGRYSQVAYDFSNRITSIADIVRGVTDTYGYDASGIRYKKTETIDGVEVTIFTTYAGSNILLEETYSNGAWQTAKIEVAVAVVNVGRFEKDFSTNQESLKYYYQDHLGNRVGVVDESGAVLATIT